MMQLFTLLLFKRSFLLIFYFYFLLQISIIEISFLRRSQKDKTLNNHILSKLYFYSRRNYPK